MKLQILLLTIAITGTRAVQPRRYNSKKSPSCTPYSSNQTWTYVQNTQSTLTSDVYFTLVQTPNTDWNTARTVCSSIGNDTSLASVVTADENSAIRNLTVDPVLAWMSGYYDESGTWYWIYGRKSMNEIFNYANWEAGFPSGSDTRMTVLNTGDGKWQDLASNGYLGAVVCMVRCGTNYS